MSAAYRRSTFNHLLRLVYHLYHPRCRLPHCRYHMAKEHHEIRDAIHGFVRLTTRERQLIDSPPIQRLRHIHQLATTFMVYPGATHSRFEHSLGVSDIATRIFDVVVREEHLRSVHDLLDVDRETIGYWRNVLRVAALCHDAGHLPFSHAAESELLPAGWNHERLTLNLIMDGPLTNTIQSMRPSVTPEDVAKIAVSPSVLPPSVVESLTDWEAIVAEIISGPVFGADRMDYLLRDSHHIGVAYGRYDQHRLIDTIRILPAPPAPPADEDDSSQSRELTLGVELGGLQTAESLLLARYFMFKQVYFHHVRRIYDLHLLDFLKLWLPDGEFPTEIDKHVSLSDPVIIAEMQNASVDEAHRAHDAARRFITRKHFRHVYSPRPDHLDISQDPGDIVFRALVDICGNDNVKHDVNYDTGGSPDFPVVLDDGAVVSAVSVSDVLKDMPLSFDSVYVAPEMMKHAHDYLQINIDRVLEGSSS